MRVYKYEISLDQAVTELIMPEGSKILSVGNQNEALVLWAEAPITTLATAEKKRIVCCLTGRDYILSKDAVFIGTVLFAKGNFVVHVFEDK